MIKKSYPGYCVEYVSGYLGMGINEITRKIFRTENERDHYIKDLTENNINSYKTYIIENCFHEYE